MIINYVTYNIWHTQGISMCNYRMYIYVVQLISISGVFSSPSTFLGREMSRGGFQAAQSLLIGVLEVQGWGILTSKRFILVPKILEIWEDAELYGKNLDRWAAIRQKTSERLSCGHGRSVPHFGLLGDAGAGAASQHCWLGFWTSKLRCCRPCVAAADG
jgi:hypothetical protein